MWKEGREVDKGEVEGKERDGRGGRGKKREERKWERRGSFATTAVFKSRRLWGPQAGRSPVVTKDEPDSAYTTIRGTVK